jgi:dTDP-4-dehydrorhamnose reductase
MAKILITGSSGFVGWNAVRYFVERGHDVVAGFHTLPHYLHKVAGCQPVPLELTERDATSEVVARFQPSLIIHAAALARPQRDSDPTQVYRFNVDGTENIARGARQFGIPLVYISTDLVYPENAGRCDESTPVAPSGANSYSRSKLEGEARVMGRLERWIIIRPSLMYGDGTPRSNSFSQFIDGNWKNGRPAPLFTDQFRSFLYVGDLLSAIEVAALQRACWNEIFVCGGAERMSRGEFGLRYAAAMGVDPGMCRLMRADELPGYVGGPSDIAIDPARLRGIGWNPRPHEVCFAEMIAGRAQAIVEEQSLPPNGRRESCSENQSSEQA